MDFSDIPAEPEAVVSLEKSGIKGDFKSSPLNKQAAIDAVLIITMGEKIKNAILGKFPGMQSKVYSFAYFFSGKELEMDATPGFAETVAGLIDENPDRLPAI